MKLHSPQLVSLSEASLLHALMSETRRPNLLVVCRRVTVEAAARHIVSYCAPPFHMVALPGLLDLTEVKGGTLVLADVAMMSLGQQMRLYDWLSVDGKTARRSCRSRRSRCGRSWTMAVSSRGCCIAST